MGLDTKTYWLTDRQSQCDFDFDKNSSVGREPLFREYLSPEEKEETFLEAVNRKRVVKTLQAGKDSVYSSEM
jgi:hypothetical protein